MIKSIVKVVFGPPLFLFITLDLWLVMCMFGLYNIADKKIQELKR